MNSNLLTKNKNRKSILTKIKSKYIFKKIFHFISQRKFLNIIKYNKEIQKKLDIDLKDYNEFLQIEIEVIPAKNKYGKIINIQNDKDEKFVHIFLNDNIQEETSKKAFISENHGKN